MSGHIKPDGRMLRTPENNDICIFPRCLRKDFGEATRCVTRLFILFLQLVAKLGCQNGRREQLYRLSEKYHATVTPEELRYAAACTLRTLSHDQETSEMIVKTQDIIRNLLKMVKNDYTGIVLLHLRTLANLIEWDPVEPLKQNAFQIMLKLFTDNDMRIVCAAMDCMTQLCHHDVGKLLADEYDLTFFLRSFLTYPHVDLKISAAGLMARTTLTTRSKWRAKQVCRQLTKDLVALSQYHALPLLQLRVIQILINLCDCPDIRYHMKRYWFKSIQQINIKTHEEWSGTVETTSMGLETGHNYRTMCIESMETIKNDRGDTSAVVNVHSYLRRLQEKKEQLIATINWKCYA